MRVQECRDESTESRECRLESAMCENRVESAESVRVQSREYRECEGTESRGGSRVHGESTV